MPLSSATSFKTTNAAGVDQLASGLQASAGAGSAGAILAANSSGKLDSTFVPAGFGSDSATILASEAIAAGAFVNVYNNAGVENVRNADQTAANAGKPANGFALTAIASGATGTINFNGLNTAVTGQTPGPVFLGATGAATSTVPTTSGYSLQSIGDAVSATSIHFQRGPVTIL